MAMSVAAQQKKMNESMSQLQIKSDSHVRQMLLERKRLEDLEEALKVADDQIKSFRLETKATGVSLLNHYRKTALPAKLRTEAFDARSVRADGADVGRAAETRQKKLLSGLEHKLDKLKIRSSQSEAQNEALKREINSLRRHRKTADKNRLSIEKAIKKTQKEVKRVLLESRDVCDERDKLVEDLRDLQKTQAEDRENFVKEVTDLTAFIDRQNKEFEECLAAAATSTTKLGDDEHGEEFFITRGSMTIAEEKMKMELVCEIESQLAAEKEATTQTEAKIQKYKESFEELKRVSGIFDIKEIVQQYVKSEEETFSLFNYIQALNQETDWTLERRARLEEEIHHYEETLAEEEAQRTEAMATLQGKWRNAKEATDECSHAALEAQRTLERIAKKIHSLFFKIQCDQLLSGSGQNHQPTDTNAAQPSPAAAAAAASPGSADDSPKKNPSDETPILSKNNSDSLVVVPAAPPRASIDANNRLAILSGQGVTESNILAYAELIEKRALEIMADYIRKTNPADQRKTVLSPSRALRNGSQHFFPLDHVKAPDVVDSNNDDDDDNDDDDSRPIALDEMRRRTAEMLAKKHSMTRIPSKRTMTKLLPASNHQGLRSPNSNKAP